MSGLETYIALDQLLRSPFGVTASVIGRELRITPRHARRLIDKLRDAFGAVWELQIVEERVLGQVFYRYRDAGASAFTDSARRVVIHDDAIAT